MEKPKNKKIENRLETAKATTEDRGMSRRRFLEGATLALGVAMFGENILKNAETLSRVAQAEAGEKAPKISFDIFFSGHVFKEDADGLTKKLLATDIYIPEIAGWDGGLKKDLNDVSFGRLSPEQLWAYGDYMANAFQDAEVRALFGKRVPIYLIDITSENSLMEKLVQSLEDLGELNFKDTFEVALQKKKASLKKYADLQKERERHIAKELATLIDKISKHQMPEVTDKDHVRILLQLGSIHTGVYHTFRGKNTEMQRHFKTGRHIYNLENEATRRYLFGKEVSDELIAKVILEHMLVKLRRRIVSEENMATERAALKDFTTEKIKQLYDEQRKKISEVEELPL